MALDPGFDEQEALAETLQRADSEMSPRERFADLLVGLGFAATVAMLWWARPPHGFAVEPAVLCVLVMALAMRVRFDTPLGFTVPTQLAFVPLLFAMPLATVPLGVLTALLLGKLPELRRAKTRARHGLTVLGNASLFLGPVILFVACGTGPRQASPALLIAALAAQFVLDFAISTVRFGVDRGATVVSQARSDLWVYGFDAALAPVGLLAAVHIQQTPLAGLAVVPLLGLLSVFAHERQRRLQSLLELNSAYRGTALVLGDVIEADDGYTGVHSKSVVQLALEVGAALGLDGERRRNLEFAALLHDVGKIAIPKEIINKPGKLNPEEWAIIKTHTLEGQEMLDRVGGFMRDVGLIVRSHHERWDGAGYPDGLAGEAIPLEARIIACCDTWNAMRTDRAYRRALSYEVAEAELIASAGSQLDPQIVQKLLAIVAEHPSGAPAPAPRAVQVLDSALQSA